MTKAKAVRAKAKAVRVAPPMRNKSQIGSKPYREVVRKLAGPEYGERVAMIDLVEMPAAIDAQRAGLLTLVAYFSRGWCLPDTPGQHMVEIEDQHATETAFRNAARMLKTLHRCYCESCLGDDPFVDEEDGAAAIAMLEIRLAVAKANKLGQPGPPHVEAQIDAILKGES